MAIGLGIGLGYNERVFPKNKAILEAYDTRVVADGGTVEGLGCAGAAISWLRSIKIGASDAYDEASLLFVPSGYKANKLYCLKPIDGSADIDTVRATAATRTDPDRFLEGMATGVPRVNFSPNYCPNYLAERTSINYCLRSNEFDNVIWVKNQTAGGMAPVITAASGISPDGTNNAFKAVFNAPASGDRSSLTQALTMPTSGSYCATIYIKAFSSTDVGKIIAMRTVGGGAYGLFTLTNEWQRIERTEAYVTGVIELELRPSVGTSTGEVNALIYGAQVESANALGIIPTSYIPTGATTAQRDIDLASKTGIGASIGQTEGTIVIDYIYEPNTGGSPIFIQPTGVASINNAIALQNNGASTNFYGLFVGGVAQFLFSETIETTTRLRAVIGYKANDFALYVNGVQKATDVSGSVAASYDDLYLGYYPDGIARSMQNGINLAALYTTRYSNDILQKLSVIPQ